MRIITGDECGLLKETIPELSRARKGEKESERRIEEGISRLGQQEDIHTSLDNGDYDDEIMGGALNMSRSRGIVDLSFCASTNSNSDGNTSSGNGSLSFCALRVNGSVERWEGMAPSSTRDDCMLGGTYTCIQSAQDIFRDDSVEQSLQNGEKNGGTIHLYGRPVAMCSVQRTQQTDTVVKNNNVLACCSSLGYISLLDSNHLGKGVVARYNVYSKNGKEPVINYTKGNFVNRSVVTAMDMNYDGTRIAVGGRERSTTILDLETGNSLWKAKNLPPNNQTLLQQPIWSTAIMFMDPAMTTSATAASNSTSLLAVGTAYKQLQIYDIRTDSTQRRPVIYTPQWDSNKKNLLNHRITCLSQLDGNKILVGDAAGYVHTLDIRKIGNESSKFRSLDASVGRYNGPCGSVRQIIKHETLPVLAVIGLDRMLRTYDTNSRKQLDCVYLKQRLNCALFCEDKTWKMDGSISGESSTHDSSNTGYHYIEDEEGSVGDADKVEDYVDSSEDEHEDEGVHKENMDHESDSDSNADDTDDFSEDTNDTLGSDSDSDEEDDDYKMKAPSKRRRQH